jgi:hypothetical protein
MHTVKFVLSIQEEKYDVDAGPPDGVILDMSTRLDIAIDIAHALTYLHYYTGTPEFTQIKVCNSILQI